MEMGCQRHAPAALPPGKRCGTHCTGTVWPVRKISPLTGPRSPDHPVRGESLYRLSYPGLLSNIAHTIKRRKGDWIGPIFCRNCPVKHVIAGKIEGRIEVTGRRGRTRKQLLVDLKETRGYWKLKEGARDRTLWRTRFGRGY